MAPLVTPQILKGFRDSLPGKEIAKKNWEARLQKVFESFGFVPIDTPALEYTQVLLGKGGGETDKQIYRFQDNGGRDVALRFDLTVPFARYMALYHNQLAMPFRRYHMAKVWRGENTQKGRYREFTQCDFDIVGVDSTEADLEILLVMAASLSALVGDQYSIHISHRGLFNRFLENEGLIDHSAEILRTVDKLNKIGREEVLNSLIQQIQEPRALRLMEYIESRGSFEEILSILTRLAGGENPDSERMASLWNLLGALGLQKHFVLDPTITRGLDYYTGVVYESFLTALPQIGSVCSGGRYNNLAGLYTKEDLPGVGAAVGLDRLMAGLEELGLIQETQGLTKALLLNLGVETLSEVQKCAQELRSREIAVEVFPEAKKLAVQYKYAEAKSIPYVITLDLTAVKGKNFNIKNLNTQKQHTSLSLDELCLVLNL